MSEEESLSSRDEKATKLPSGERAGPSLSLGRS